MIIEASSSTDPTKGKYAFMNNASEEVSMTLLGDRSAAVVLEQDKQRFRISFLKIPDLNNRLWRVEEETKYPCKLSSLNSSDRVIVFAAGNSF